MLSLASARRIFAGLFLLLSCLAPGAATAAPFAYVPRAGAFKLAKVDLATGSVAADITLTGASLASTISHNGRRVYAVLQTAGQVVVIDPATDTVLTTVTVGSLPWSATLSPDDSRLYVVNSGSNSISVINTSTNSVVATIPVNAQPRQLAVSPDGTRGYLTVSPGQLQVIDLNFNTVVATLTVGNAPNPIVLNAAGTRAYIGYAGDSTVRVLDTVSNSIVATIALGTNKAPNGLALAPDQQTLYVSQFLANQVVAIDLASQNIVTTYIVGTRPYGIDITGDGARVYVANRDSNSLSVIDTASQTIAGTISLGTNAQPWAIGRFLQPQAAVAIISPPPPGGTWHTPYAFRVNTTGVPAPVLSVSSGNLPPGLTLSADGLISGTPTQVGTYAGVLQAVGTTATVTQSFSIEIAAAWPVPPIIDAVVPGDGELTVYFTPAPDNGNAPATMFNAFCGFAASSATSPIVVRGLANGVPITCTMNAINSAGGGVASAPFAAVTPGIAPAFAAFDPPVATWNAPFSYGVVATGAPVPVLSLAQGDLPAGLTLDTSSGSISGTPTAVGSATVRLRATNALGSVTSDELTIVVEAALPAAPAAAVATAGDAQLSLAIDAPVHWGGETAGTYKAICMPGGVIASGATSPLTVSGLANGVAATCEVTAVNTKGPGPSITTVAAMPGVAPQFAPFAPPRARWNESYSYTISASGSPAPVLGIAQGDLPAGLAFDAASGSISGTPTAIGSTTVRLSASNALQTITSDELTINVDAVAPAAPVSVVATPGNGAVTLTFAAPSHWGGESAGSYAATCSPGNGSATGTASPLTVKGLSNGVAGTCMVSAVNSVTAGPAASASAVTPRAPADLGVDVDNAADFIAGGSVVSYLIVVGNEGPNAVSGAQLIDEPPATLTAVNWTCSATGGAVCPAPSGTGAIDSALTLPAGTSLRYVLSGTVPALPETPLVHSVSVLAPGSVLDANTANDSASDGPDPVGVFRDGFD
jgi:uncharacterized repeat protein (TIGR01451 family)